MLEFSVIVLNWNGKHFLDVCLSSLRRQSFRNFETILVDNGSSDGSVDFVRDNCPEVRLIALERNIGFSAGNAEGYAVARGEWIVLLNNDTEASEQWLQALSNQIGKSPDAGALACKMVYFDQRDKIDNCGFQMAASGATLEVGRDQRYSEWCHSIRVFGGCGGAVAYRRTMLEEIGFLDPDFFMTYEDTDLAFRAQLWGYPCVFVPAAIVFHRYRATMQHYPARQVYFSQRNIEFVYFKNMPATLMLRYMPRRIIYEIGAAIYFSRLRLGRTFFKAKLDAIRKLPALLGKRKGIQAGRKISNDELRSMLQRSSLGPKWKKLWSAFRRPVDTPAQDSTAAV